jgi:hypothetical protein
VQERVGAVFVPFQLARKPKLVVALGARVPFHVSLMTEYGFEPSVVRPPQI